jgi:hypothetical protein
MTKKVRIENADGYPATVIVKTQHLFDGQWIDVPAETQRLGMPAQMTEVHVHKHRRYIIEEVE